MRSGDLPYSSAPLLTEVGWEQQEENGLPFSHLIPFLLRGTSDTANIWNEGWTKLAFALENPGSAAEYFCVREKRN